MSIGLVPFGFGGDAAHTHCIDYLGKTVCEKS